MTFSSQELESYVPVYNAIPDSWEEARPFLVEVLRKMSEGVNIREIGWFLDEELLSGKAFIPGVTVPGNNPSEFRQIFRKVIDTGALIAGANIVPHGIVFDTNFTLIQLWVSGTNTGTLTARTINGNDVVMDATNLVITSPQVFDGSFCVCEYLLEV